MCTLLKEGRFPEITEIHPGHCAVGDMWHVKAFVIPPEACAAAVVCTVMSAANPKHAMVDAGYKTFGADSLIQYRDSPGFFGREDQASDRSTGEPTYG